MLSSALVEWYDRLFWCASDSTVYRWWTRGRHRLCMNLAVSTLEELFVLLLWWCPEACRKCLIWRSCRLDERIPKGINCTFWRRRRSSWGYYCCYMLFMLSEANCREVLIRVYVTGIASVFPDIFSLTGAVKSLDLLEIIGREFVIW